MVWKKVLKLQMMLIWASVLVSGCERSEINGSDHFAYSAFDSRKSIDENLKNLNGVSEVKNKKFDRLGEC